MPGLRQPEPLEKLAFNRLLFRSVNYCDDLSFGGYLTRLRQSVTGIKQHVHSHVPATVFVEFCRTFLENFYRIGEGRPPIERPASHHRAALEMITDVEIIGLTFEGCMMNYFDPVEAPRIHGLKVLDGNELEYYQPITRGLENFNLQDLTTFSFPRNCTDHHLWVIASQCLKLQVLKVEESQVTDKGLFALRSCSHLRILRIHYCLVLDEGVNHVLDVHTKLQEFNVGDCHTYSVDNFSILSRSISSVCPSVKRFSLKTNLVTDAHLTSVVTLFPNLTYLDFCCQITGDLCILKDLKYLTELRFVHSSGNLSLVNLKQLLMTVGENISVLTIQPCDPNVGLTQNDLNFIFKFCSNIEHFSFDYEGQQPMDTLVIPPFKKLISLSCIALPNYDDENSRVRLEFGKMLALDALIIENFDQIFDMIESIMLDNVRFPKLRAVGMFNNPNERTDRIQETARSELLEAMPKLRQPISLKDISMDILVAFLADYCDQLTAERCLEKLQQLVADIKRKICPNIAWNLSAEFCKKFFQKYENLLDLRLSVAPESYRRAVLEIMMDRKITGLECEVPFMCSLNIDDVHRFQGLRLLNLPSASFFSHKYLENFQLQDLTTFIYTRYCTDASLKVIGLNCPNLVFIDVAESESVTDLGLRYLNSCSNLRFVIASFCRISYSGIKELLSVNTKIESLSAWTNSERDGFDCFSQPDLRVYESISQFTIVLNHVSDEHLRSVVTKFPNLTSLGIFGYLAGDLCILKSLRNLSRLDFTEASGFSWDNLKKLLALIIGNKISELRMCCISASPACLIQSDLNFLFRMCSDIEHLEFDYRAHFDSEILVIPPFKKLKNLECRIPRQYRRRQASLEFGKMLELENLTIKRFHITVNTIKSMIFDNDKFPNLKVMKVSEISGPFDGIDHFSDITQIAKDNNLDFEIVGAV